MTGSLWLDGSDGLRTRPLGDDVRAEVCVVGLGAAGLAAMARLAERGVTATGIDAGPAGGGASGRNGGFLLGGGARFHHRMVAEVGRERAVGIYRATLDELDRLEASLPRVVRRVGSLRIAADEGELVDCAAHRDVVHADGIAVEDYDGPEGRGILLPDDASFDPAQRCRVVAGDLVAAGASLHTDTPAVGLGDGHVTTEHGGITCQQVVVAVDGGLERLLPELSARVRTARAQMLATAPTEPRFDRPVYRRDGYDYYQQTPDGPVALGGFRDGGGQDEWTHDTEPTSPVQDLLERYLGEVLDVDAPITHRWAGSIAFTRDGLPIVERVRDRVVACGAYSGTGNLVGPLAGRAAADLALDGRSATADLLASGR